MKKFSICQIAALVFFLAINLGTPENSVADVVINEVFYHAPDELDLEYIELFNTSTATVDLSDWKLAKGVAFTFPKGTKLKAGGYAVVGKNADLIEEFYNIDLVGQFEKSLSNSGDEIELRDSANKVVDRMAYRDRAPWPISADGYSASLERVCPAGPANDTSNWAASELSNNYQLLPAGTPGRANSVVAKVAPPKMRAITWWPEQPNPGTELSVTVRSDNSSALREVQLHYRLVAPGAQGKAQTQRMTRIGNLFTTQIPTGNDSNRLLRFQVVATAVDGGITTIPAANDLRPAHSVYVGNAVEADKIPVLQFFHIGKREFEAGEAYRTEQASRYGGYRGGYGRGGFQRGGRGGGFDRGRGGRGQGGNTAFAFMAQGPSAVVYTDPTTGTSEVYDFVHITRRKSGWKVRLHKDKPLLGMTSINVLYEPNEPTILNEALAYELYRMAGNASCASGYMRLIVNGKPAGYHLYFEQPNGNFFRRNNIKDKGDLYKLIWMGNAEMSRRVRQDQQRERRDITGRHEKMTNRHVGHAGLINVIEELETANSDQAMWNVIEARFDVDNVVNYFAVNSLLSHWDGFFNNYFVYLDSKGSGKWSLYPWDQDSTWSQRGGRPADLYRMPLYFGAQGATPQGIVRSSNRNQGRDQRRGGFGGRGRGGFGSGGYGWWRDGGDFSRPMLANPEFNRRFQKRLKELTEQVFNEEIFGPKIDQLRTSLEPEVRLRARLRNGDEDAAVDELARTTGAMREHLVQRRTYVRRNLKLEAASN